MILMSLKAKPRGYAIECYGIRYGHLPCIPPGAMAEMNCRLRWKNQEPELKPVLLPYGWNVSFHGGGIQRPVLESVRSLVEGSRNPGDHPCKLRSGPQSMWTNPG